MAELAIFPPLVRESVLAAHERIKSYIQLTPVLTSHTLSSLASTPQTPEALLGTEWEGKMPAKPKFNLFFKCENYQQVGAFKSRGAFHALLKLSDEEVKHGVCTHSSGNHAQALALAARTRGIPAYVIMPSISTPSKIAATKGYGAEVIFSGSTSEEREQVMREVQIRTGAKLVPPYNHPDIILGQGTMALEFETQVDNLLRIEGHCDRYGGKKLDAIIAPCGGGGMLSGIATAMYGTGVKVFGAEPSFQGADDCGRSLKNPTKPRITSVKTLTIADGLRTPVGEIPWSIISDKTKVKGVFAVTEEQIRDAMRLVLERMKVVVEPSGVVGLAVALYNEGFRRLVEEQAGDEGWNLGVIFSGGNTTVEAIGKIFGGDGDERNGASHRL